jgi:acyl-CoA thioester hydrolase
LIEREACGTDIHCWPIRVYYEDTDAGGIVYYANYLKFAERARTEMMRELGTSHSEMTRTEGLSFAVARCEVDYLKSARLDDLLEVRTRIVEVGGATLDALQVIRRSEGDVARLKVRLACLNRDGRARRIPASVRAALSRFQQSEERVE